MLPWKKLKVNFPQKTWEAALNWTVNVISKCPIMQMKWVIEDSMGTILLVYAKAVIEIPDIDLETVYATLAYPRRTNRVFII